MPFADLVCLANARKRSERCIACLHPETASFVRLVSSADHGELTYAQRHLGAYGEPQKLDLIRVNIARNKPSPGQPENCLVDSKPWQLLERPANGTKLAALQRALQTDGWIFGTTGDRIPSATFAANPPASSLALIRPSHVRWLFETIGSKQRVRALFCLSGSSYNLSLTDPILEEQLKSLPNGVHASSSIDLHDEQLAFCVSLGEAFSDGNCYKLVAGVMELPRR
jgi:hypothetical protein